MLLDFLFPNRCLNCNRIIDNEELVCEACFEHISFTHATFDQHNELANRCRLLFPVESAFPLMFFEEDTLTRQIIHELKYKGREKAGKVIANWVAEQTDLRKIKPDLMVTVPLHPKKLQKRGYNQLHLFGNTLSLLSGIPIEHELLKRNHHHKAQALKDKSQRSVDENRFTIQEKIENKHVLILDDVFTTGNTMASAAWEILSTQNNKVSILVMALEL